VSVSTVSKWLRRVERPVVAASGKGTAAKPSNPSDASRGPQEPATAASGDGEKIGSGDVDPTNRQIDRLLARLGQLHDAAPLFASGKRIPRAGALLAIPALV
jgi:hypothetical protein